MKKKEVRWISRDMEGDYEIWKRRPRRSGIYWASGNLISILCDDLKNYAGIVLAPGSLAKVTIERQY